MRAALIALIAFAFAGCKAGEEVGGASVDAVSPRGKPTRIVSLDYCADQFVLKLADRENILALSPDAGKNFSYMRAAAAGIPTVKATAEDVLVLQPDLVVRSYGGGPNAASFFERAGVPVLNVGWTSQLDGPGPDSIPSVIEQMAAGLGEPDRGAVLIAEFRRRLSAIEREHETKTALYITPSGFTTGSGSLMHEMVLAAGFENFESKPGWRPMPLERLAYEQPDIAVTAFFEEDFEYLDAWSAIRHPIARKLLDQKDTVPLHGAWTACGTWFVMDAIETMAAATP